MLGGHFPCDASATRLVLTHNYWLFPTENLFARPFFKKRLEHFSSLSREFWVFKRIVCFNIGLLGRWRDAACCGLGSCLDLRFSQHHRSPRSWAVSASCENTPNLNCKYPRSIFHSCLPTKKRRISCFQLPQVSLHYLIINKGGLFTVISYFRDFIETYFDWSFHKILPPMICNKSTRIIVSMTYIHTRE